MRPMNARSSYKYKQYAERRRVYRDLYHNKYLNNRDNSTAASTQSSISNTVKRGYEETTHQPVINANTNLTISNAKQILNQMLTLKANCL